MALIRLNNQSISSVTALPSGVGGKVLQVLSTTKTDTFSTTSQTPVDITGLSLNITPSSTSSKILITGFVSLSETNDANAYIVINAGGSTVGVATSTGDKRAGHTGYGYDNDDEVYRLDQAPVNYLWSPNSTSQQTIKLQLGQGDSTGATLYVNRSVNDTNFSWLSRMTSTLTVKEIGA